MRMQVNRLIEEIGREIPKDFADDFSMVSPSSTNMEGGERKITPIPTFF